MTVCLYAAAIITVSRSNLRSDLISSFPGQLGLGNYKRYYDFEEVPYYSSLFVKAPGSKIRWNQQVLFVGTGSEHTAILTGQAVMDVKPKIERLLTIGPYDDVDIICT